MPPSRSSSATVRWAYFLLGWVFFGIGVLGAFLPVLPTTPLMIVALWAFSKSSPRFHDWLYTHKLFGPPLRRWQEHRVIPLVAKFAAVGAMTASLAYLVFLTTVPWVYLALTAGLMAGGAAYILTKPSKAPGS